VTPHDSGYVHVYTGDGKGKTTAAIGLAVRAAGYGLLTYIGQFMKGQRYGELTALRQLPGITVEQYGDQGCIRKEEVSPAHRARANAGLRLAREATLSRRYDIIVLDEVNVALWFGLLEEEAVVKLLDERPPEIEMVLTGRGAPKALLDRADLVTEMRAVKHYYNHGLQAREGIEY